MRVKELPANTFCGFYNNPALLKTAEFAANNGALFAAGTSFILSTFVRPIAILATPNAEKENKEYACAKSISSSLVGLGIVAFISNPIIRAVRNIEEKPSKFLNENTIKALKGEAPELSQGANFKFSSQMFKLGSGFVSILPKAILTALLVPPVMSLFFNKKVNKPDEKIQNENLSFGAKIPNKGLYQCFTEKISIYMGKFLSKKPVQNFADRYNSSNFPQHIFSANDVFATALFAKCISNNKKIEQDRKKTLIWNASIMTAFTVLGGYFVNAVLKKPTEMFIEKFRQANINSPKLEKYVEGIKIAKPAIILGALYYMAAPIASTILAEVFSKKQNGVKNG